MSIGIILKEELEAALAIAKKDIKIYYLKASTLMFAIIFPFAMFFAFAVGRDVPLSMLFSGLISITLLFSASSVGPSALPLERRIKAYDRLIAAPISGYTVIIGKVLSGWIFGIIIGLIILGVSLLTFKLQVFNPLSLLLGLIIGSFCFSMLGIMLAMLPRENPGDVMLLLNFIRLPLIFISGIFIRVETLPYWGQIASIFSPLTYTNDLIRLGLEGKSTFSPLLNSAILVCFSAVFLYLAKKIDVMFRE
jgi:ABC-2 type transport system permease protein